MDLSYTRPLQAAWARMKSVLFPAKFSIEQWFVMGLSAWLADIFSSGSSGLKGSSGKRDFEDLAEGAGSLLEHPGVLLAFGVGFCVILVLSVVLLWVSTRSQFVFLDNVVHGRAAFVGPWKRYGRLGNSLFWWHAAMSFAWLVPLACVLVPLLPAIAGLLAGNGWDLVGSLGLVAGVAMAALLGVLLLAVYALNENFVVPLMWKHDEGVRAAWGRFGALLAKHPGDFGAWLVFAFLVALAAIVAVVLAGLMTCCIGLAIAALPYFGAVLLLPMHFTFRAFGPEFLRQYGPEWDVWAGMTQPEQANTSSEGSPIA